MLTMKCRFISSIFVLVACSFLSQCSKKDATPPPIRLISRFAFSILFFIRNKYNEKRNMIACKKNKILVPFFFLLYSLIFTIHNLAAQAVYNIDATVPDATVIKNQLKLGGADPSGKTITVNNNYLSINNRPFIPVTGEFHFSRFPNQYWDEAIKKMKAGGINTIATYVFWNIHDDAENEFRWDGDRDVRKFIELCYANNLYVIVRIGPFCHGEIRNGGLPDWLMAKPLMVRSNDAVYLGYVERLYKNIAAQLSGLYFKNGGPIIGIQIENEYQHSAAPWGLTYPGQPADYTAAEKDLKLTKEGVSVSKEKNPYAALGNDHMKVLKSLAVGAGMDVPLYTATGWGNAAIIPNESVPVTAAYAYPTWVPKTDASPFFLYKDMHKDPDYSPVRYKPEDYPVFAAELGSGIMVTYVRRPTVVHKSFDALINRCLGSGANGIGYYMYHGGSTPVGDHYFFSDEAGSMPKISYDFQAPIGEFGQVREGFHRLKLLHFFIQEFDSLLAQMVTVLPENAGSLTPENTSELRFAVRKKGNAGFLFLNNFQDDVPGAAKHGIQINIKTNAGIVSIPQSGGIDLPEGENAIFPFNLNMHGVNLLYATAQLLTKSDDEKAPYYVFFKPGDLNAAFVFNRRPGYKITGGKNVSVTQTKSQYKVACADSVAEFFINKGKEKITVLVINKSLALQSYSVNIHGKKSLIFANALVLQNGKEIQFISDSSSSISANVFPRVSAQISIASVPFNTAQNDFFTSISMSLPRQHIDVTTRSIGEKKIIVQLPESLNGLNDLFLFIDYTGDTGMGFLDGKLVTDEFYKGTPWRIGLKKFYPAAAGKEMIFYFRPLMKNAPFLSDLNSSAIPDFGKGKQFLKINNIHFQPQYSATIQF